MSVDFKQITENKVISNDVRDVLVKAMHEGDLKWEDEWNDKKIKYWMWDWLGQEDLCFTARGLWVLYDQEKKILKGCLRQALVRILESRSGTVMELDWEWNENHWDWFLTQWEGGNGLNDEEMVGILITKGGEAQKEQWLKNIKQERLLKLKRFKKYYWKRWTLRCMVLSPKWSLSIEKHLKQG